MFNWFKKPVAPVGANLVEQIAERLNELLDAREKPRYASGLIDPLVWDREWVVMPDGKLGVIDHRKTNSEDVAVRPVNLETMEYLPNQSPHWTPEQKNCIPHEIVVHRDFIRPAPQAAIPKRPTSTSS